MKTPEFIRLRLGPAWGRVVLAILATVNVHTTRGAEPAVSTDVPGSYVADVRQAQEAAHAGDAPRARALLVKHQPGAGQPDLRGFEWHFLWRNVGGATGPAITNSPRTPLTGLVRRNPISPLIFVRQGRVLASACADSIARQFDLTTMQEATEMAGVEHPLHLCTDGHTLIATGYSGLQVWDLRSQVLAPIWYFPKDGDWVLSAFSPDGQWAVVRNGGGQLQFIDVIKRRELAFVPAHGGEITALAASPDGRTAASAGGDRLVKLWDFERRASRATLQDHTATITALAFAPDGNTLASAGMDKAIRLWPTTTKAAPRRLNGHEAGVLALAFSPDGKTLASGGMDSTVRLWNVVQGEVLLRLSTSEGAATGAGNPAARLAFAPDGSVLAARLFDGSLRVWRAKEPASDEPAPAR